jgi:GGDEF domain-containing protein
VTTEAPAGFEPREAFEEALLRETAFARRHGIRLALFLIEVDGLAQAVPAAVEGLAARLRALAPTEVSLARVSPSVCALVLRGLDPAQAHAEAERIAAAVTSANLRACVGAATFHTVRAASSDALFHAAELALLASKKPGAGCAVVEADGVPEPGATPPAAT